MDNGVCLYVCVCGGGGCFADFNSFFLKYPMKMN